MLVIAIIIRVVSVFSLYFVTIKVIVIIAIHYFSTFAKKEASTKFSENSSIFWYVFTDFWVEEKMGWGSIFVLRNNAAFIPTVFL